MRPIRVLRVITRLNVGGPTRQVVSLARGLDRRGFRTILAVGRPGPDEGDLGALARDAGVEVAMIPGLGRAPAALDDARALASLVGLVRRFRPAIVHTHTAKAGALGRVAALLGGASVRVHTLHGHVFHGYFGPLASRAVVLAERLLARISTRIVVLSEAQRREVVRRYRIAGARRVCVIGPGLDLSPFRDMSPDADGLRVELGVPAGRPLLGAVGRLVPVKGLEDAIEAAARIPGAALAIAGVGPERARLESLARARGVDARFLGLRSDLARIYAGLDVLLLPSRNEGTPLALIEAMASGCPCVAARVGGVADVLGEAGLLVPPRDVDALAAAVRRLLDDPELRAAYASAGRERAPALFGEDRLVSDTAAMYHRLLEEAGRARRATPAPS